MTTPSTETEKNAAIKAAVSRATSTVQPVTDERHDPLDLRAARAAIKIAGYVYSSVEVAGGVFVKVAISKKEANALISYAAEAGAKYIAISGAGHRVITIGRTSF